jgi:hypothetical protein
MRTLLVVVVVIGVSCAEREPRNADWIARASFDAMSHRSTSEVIATRCASSDSTLVVFSSSETCWNFPVRGTTRPAVPQRWREWLAASGASFGAFVGDHLIAFYSDGRVVDEYGAAPLTVAVCSKSTGGCCWGPDCGTAKAKLSGIRPAVAELEEVVRLAP